MRTARQLLAVAWALPWSIVGAAVGAAGLAGRGARVRRSGRTLEFSGPFVAWLLARLPSRPAAMTLGHVILGRSAAALDLCRRHEQVHVGQYERWGLFFVPAYLLCSAGAWLAGRDPYWDNPFEREAFEATK